MRRADVSGDHLMMKIYIGYVPFRSYCLFVNFRGTNRLYQFTQLKIVLFLTVTAHEKNDTSQSVKNTQINAYASSIISNTNVTVYLCQYVNAAVIIQIL